VQVRAVPAESSIIRTNETLDVELAVEADEECEAWFFIGVSEGTASPVFVIARRGRLVPGQNGFRASIAHLPLPAGHYSVWLASKVPGDEGRELVPWQPMSRFEVHGPELDLAPRAVMRLAPVYVDADWSSEQAPVGAS
jgi:ABC-2 type transport system ATP-binding protein